MARIGTYGRFGNYVTTPKQISMVANGSEAQDVCLSIANILAHEAWMRGGQTYDVDCLPGRFRCHARVKTQGDHGFWKEYHHHALARTAPHMPTI